MKLSDLLTESVAGKGLAMLWRQYRFPANDDDLEPTQLLSQVQNYTDAAQQQWATILAYGRLMQAIRDDPPEPAVLIGQVFVCGVGRVAALVLIAVADLEDARAANEQRRNDPDTTVALAQAEARLRQALVHQDRARDRRDARAAHNDQYPPAEAIGGRPDDQQRHFC